MSKAADPPHVPPPIFTGGEVLSLKYVPLSSAKLWDRNAKLHDIDALASSIAIHGFRDPPAYDAALDAFVEGNGRTEALQWMCAQGHAMPRGIACDTQTGEWCMPVMRGRFQTDATLRAELFALLR